MEPRFRAVRITPDIKPIDRWGLTELAYQALSGMVFLMIIRVLEMGSSLLAAGRTQLNSHGLSDVA